MVVVYSPGPWTQYPHIPTLQSPVQGGAAVGNWGPIGAWLCPLATLDILPLTRSIFWPGYYRSRLAPRQALLIHLAFNMDMQTFCSKSGNLFQCRTPLPKNLHHNHIPKFPEGPFLRIALSPAIAGAGEVPVDVCPAGT